MSHRSTLARSLTAALGAFGAGAADADALNMPEGVTQISRSIYGLHMLIFWICVAIGVVVFAAMLYSMIAHRRSRRPEPARFHENTRLEIFWTIVPFAILVAMAVPATSTLIDVYDAGEPDLTIEVRGYQWKWEYTYLDANLEEEFSFFSNLATPADEIRNRSAKGRNYLLEVDEPVVIPTDRKVRFLLTANDVIHSWWVPELGIKRDAIPGFINDVWAQVEEPGVYRGQCTELCGKDHAFMPVVVDAVAPEAFDDWYDERLARAERRRELTDKEWSAEELYERGEGVYTAFCAACHQPNGQGVPPAFPSLVGAPTVTGPKAGHIDIVYNGKRGTAMQAFAGQLDPVDMAAVIHYERHAWGNDSGDVVTPQDIIDFASEQ